MIQEKIERYSSLDEENDQAVEFRILLGVEQVICEFAE